MPSIDDLFPRSEREFYRKAPLFEVVCQVQFPRLLTIESKVPAEFHEEIRSGFPLAESGVGLPPMQGVPEQILKMMGSQIGGLTYRFLTEDRKSTISLNPDSLSLTTNSYVHWHKFKEQFIKPLNALRNIYKPSFFNRTGLRYQNVINREDIGLEGHPWSSLLKPEIVGRFPFPDFEANVTSIAHQVTISLPDGSGSVLFNHGYVNVMGKTGTCYLLDFDFFKDSKAEIQDAESILDHFHEFAGRAFRACAADELRQALEPTQFDEHGRDPIPGTVAHG